MYLEGNRRWVPLMGAGAQPMLFESRTSEKAGGQGGNAGSIRPLVN